ncbi:hypothetical protein PV721_06380 [Streptomyces sp. MB09-01]|uniref:hypothetical protein n=1 Tax=Streptomyces sp. MB09-01 TaxID=3028666 RepID=UPI0029A201D6|nr:hypothetical protein [Streptomyces sp. MB09-01]MDX3533997.1 hypothetical protein [Streptomyces sp. MB09-01]
MDFLAPIFGLLVLVISAIAVTVGLSREIRTRRRAGRLERALRALAARSGWHLLPPAEYRSDHQLMHFGWLDADARLVATGTSNGYEVVAAELAQIDSRRAFYWLAVYFQLPGERPMLRLERPWSAGALGIPVHGPGLYLPMSTDTDALTARLAGTNVLDQLADLRAPAVSLNDDHVCFLYHPVPDGAELERLVSGLAALLPELVRLAEEAPGNNEPAA